MTGGTEVIAPRRLVVCLDGTWNNTYNQKWRTDGHAVFKPSNVLKLARAVLPYDTDNAVHQIVSYDIGVGSVAQYPGMSNHVLAGVDKALGGGWGAGFEANIDRALGFLVLNHRPGDEVFVFGFSRGAATAQALARFIDWSGGLPVKRDAYYLSRLFRDYLEHGHQAPGEEVIHQVNVDRSKERHPLPPLEPFQPVDIVLLGVWDTVMALGSRLMESAARNRDFHVGPQPPGCVRHARQALALDEARSDFEPRTWQSCEEMTQTLEQRWFAGVHSNIGGGYVHDGLANLSLHWMMGEASALGLRFDKDFAKKYPGYAQDRMYRSESTGYRTADALRRRSGLKRRSLVMAPASARYTLDRSVIWRMQATPNERNNRGQLVHRHLDRAYRPRNAMQFLAVQHDLGAYLSSIGISPSALPADLMQAIESEREKLVVSPDAGTARFVRTRIGGQVVRVVDRIRRRYGSG